MAKSPEKPKIVFASANVADPRHPRLLLVRPEAVGHFATAAGFSGGVEYHPAFDWIASPNAIARAVQEETLAVNSLHAGFRTTRRSRDTNNTSETRGNQSLTKRAVEAVVASPLGRVIMPEVVNSSRFMAEVQDRLGPLPCVMYPLVDPTLNRRALETSGPGLKLVQASDRMAAMYGARTPEEFVEKTVVNGPYDGYIADTTHMHPDRYEGLLPRVVSDLDRSLPVLQPHIKGAHPSFGRDDIAGEKSALAVSLGHDLELALEGLYPGPTGDIMAAAWEAPGFEYAAAEVTAASMSKLTGLHTLDALIEPYRQLSYHLGEYQPAR